MKKHQPHIILALTSVLVIALRFATADNPADWPMYNHDLAGWRFRVAG